LRSRVQKFEALSDKALRQNNQAFFELANEKLGPLQKSLEQFDCKLQEVEKQRVGAYAGITQQIETVESIDVIPRRLQALEMHQVAEAS
jgi:hypothetical protein